MMNTLNNDQHGDITITFSGQFTVSRATLLEAIQHNKPAPVLERAEPQTPAESKLSEEGTLPRLAYTMRETAEILGVSYITVHRLLQRGLMRSSLAIRTKLIPRKEIEKFLATTMSDY